MIIDDEIFNNSLKLVIKAGLLNLQNTTEYYDLLNNPEIRNILKELGCETEHFRFLSYMVEHQELTMCPECYHYNDNIECPILRCEYCDHEWYVDTPHSKDVCHLCIAHQTDKCDGTPHKGANKDGTK